MSSHLSFSVCCGAQRHAGASGEVRPSWPWLRQIIAKLLSVMGLLQPAPLRHKWPMASVLLLLLFAKLPEAASVGLVASALPKFLDGEEGAQPYVLGFGTSTEGGSRSLRGFVHASRDRWKSGRREDRD